MANNAIVVNPARLGKSGERRLASVNPEDLTDGEEGEETKARLSLSRPAISDPSHPTGELRWSTRRKKNMGRSSDAAVGLAKGNGDVGVTGFDQWQERVPMGPKRRKSGWGFGLGGDRRAKRARNSLPPTIADIPENKNS
ncbi:unnamed protein product [Lactuca saligna]|uniref:Uncharacterized protein n=1 Tax=Lactuca saligna TaxID=75948 RepID=A0AA35VMR3_LACSI|nr:unnamed protein product [Lactuca saligna]